MYLSTLQKHILILARKNMINENLSLNSEAFENSIITYSNVKKANSIIQKMENGLKTLFNGSVNFNVCLEK